MAYLYDFPNATTPDQILVQVSSEVTAFFGFFLLFVFGLVFLGGTQRQKARIGTADYPMWAVVSALSILILTAVFTMISGIISLTLLVIVFVINLLCGAWLFIDRRINEG